MSNSHRNPGIDGTPIKRIGDYGDTPWRVTDESASEDSFIVDDDDEDELEESDDRDEKGE